MDFPIIPHLLFEEWKEKIGQTLTVYSITPNNFYFRVQSQLTDVQKNSVEDQLVLNFDNGVMHIPNNKVYLTKEGDYSYQDGEFNVLLAFDQEKNGQVDQQTSK